MNWKNHQFKKKLIKGLESKEPLHIYGTHTFSKFHLSSKVPLLIWSVGLYYLIWTKLTPFSKTERLKSKSIHFFPILENRILDYVDWALIVPPTPRLSVRPFLDVYWKLRFQNWWLSSDMWPSEWLSYFQLIVYTTSTIHNIWYKNVASFTLFSFTIILVIFLRFYKNDK